MNAIDIIDGMARQSATIRGCQGVGFELVVASKLDMSRVRDEGKTYVVHEVDEEEEGWRGIWSTDEEGE